MSPAWQGAARGHTGAPHRSRRSRGGGVAQRAGVELRTARRIAGLTQEQVGDRVRVSHAEICRIELGRAPWVTIQTLFRIGAVVGLELSLRFYSGPSPVRDVRSAEIMAEFARHIASPLLLRTEVPLPNSG